MKWDQEDSRDLPLVRRNRLIYYRATEDGNVVGYTKEEYGADTTAIGPKITTTRGVVTHMIVLSLSMALLAWSLAYILYRVGEVPSWLWVLPALGLALTVAFGKTLITELRARKLRQERDLPEPVE